jgi:hypothetical protein
MAGLTAMGASVAMRSPFASVTCASIAPPKTDGENAGFTGSRKDRLKLRVVVVRFVSVNDPEIDGSWFSVRFQLRSHTAPPLNEPPC